MAIPEDVKASITPDYVRAAILERWPYKSVDPTRPISECQVCHCLVVDKPEQTIHCFSMFPEEDIKVIARTMAAEIVKEHNQKQDS